MASFVGSVFLVKLWRQKRKIREQNTWFSGACDLFTMTWQRIKSISSDKPQNPQPPSPCPVSWPGWWSSPSFYPSLPPSSIDPRSSISTFPFFSVSICISTLLSSFISLRPLYWGSRQFRASGWCTRLPFWQPVQVNTPSSPLCAPLPPRSFFLFLTLSFFAFSLNTCPSPSSPILSHLMPPSRHCHLSLAPCNLSLAPSSISHSSCHSSPRHVNATEP